MSWNYAELSKMAKETGGPDALIDKLVADGISQGKESMYPVVVGAIFGSILVWESGKAIYKKLSGVGLSKSSEAELKAAREGLVQGIRDYDATQQANETIEEENEEEE